MAKGLGKGLDALISQDIMLGKSNEEAVLEIATSLIRPNPYQPRRTFDPEAIKELTQSIIANGVIQPIIVRKSSIKGYELVAGERRLRASKNAGLEKIPAVIKDFNDNQMMELALLENLQREDLTPIEEASAYKGIIEKLGYTQEELAQKMGKSRSHIANQLRLLTLPEKLQELVGTGILSMGHAKVLLGIKDEKKLVELAQKVVAENLNVRQLEKLIQESKENVPRGTLKKTTPPVDLYVKEQLELIREKFGTKVTLIMNDNKGKVQIEFLSEEDLERVLALLNKKE